ncbi:MAG: hypothetical protein K9J06_06275 [Flavobacteriales bacterium]|nr:hypothetical protein [Flavobacteriales bacterium]
MGTYLEYLLPVIGLALLAGGWMAQQIIAKKMKVKNHIDRTSGCCGACGDKAECSTDRAH